MNQKEIDDFNGIVAGAIVKYCSEESTSQTNATIISAELFKVSIGLVTAIAVGDDEILMNLKDQMFTGLDTYFEKIVKEHKEIRKDI